MLTIELSQEEIERLISWFWVVENESLAGSNDFTLVSNLYMSIGKPVPMDVIRELLK